MEKNQIDLLLSDEFVEFSAKIAEIHNTKKKMKEDFKKTYEEFQAKLASLDTTAAELTNAWESWKNEHSQKAAAEAKAKK